MLSQAFLCYKRESTFVIRVWNPFFGGFVLSLLIALSPLMLKTCFSLIVPNTRFTSPAPVQLHSLNSTKAKLESSDFMQLKKEEEEEEGDKKTSSSVQHEIRNSSRLTMPVELFEGNSTEDLGSELMQSEDEKDTKKAPSVQKYFQGENGKETPSDFSHTQPELTIASPNDVPVDGSGRPFLMPVGSIEPAFGENSRSRYSRNIFFGAHAVRPVHSWKYNAMAKLPLGHRSTTKLFHPQNNQTILSPPSSALEQKSKFITATTASPASIGNLGAFYMFMYPEINYDYPYACRCDTADYQQWQGNKGMLVKCRNYQDVSMQKNVAYCNPETEDIGKQDDTKI